jgi:hypothetical protein
MESSKMVRKDMAATSGVPRKSTRGFSEQKKSIRSVSSAVGVPVVYSRHDGWTRRVAEKDRTHVIPNNIMIVASNLFTRIFLTVNAF